MFLFLSSLRKKRGRRGERTATKGNRAWTSPRLKGMRRAMSEVFISNGIF
jgi:hypothetical protein